MKRVASRLSAVLAVTLCFSAVGRTASSENAPLDNAIPGGKAALVDKAPCARWDMSGDWAFYQSNEATPTFHVDLTDTGLQGTASSWYLVDEPHCPFFAFCGKDAVNVKGSVDGTIEGNEVALSAYWNNGTIGVYSGKIDAQGRIEGTTFDRVHPQTMASWYSDHTARCLDGTGGSGGGVGTTSSGLTTPPPEKAVRVARHDVRVPAMKTTTYTAVPVCGAAKDAQTQNSPAAATLDGMCRSSQLAAAASSVVTGPSPTTTVTPVESKTTGLARARTGIRLPQATAATVRNTAPVSGTGASIASKVSMPYSLLRKDSRFGTVAAPGMALGLNQPANSIQVRVLYARQFGYRSTSGPFGILGPTSCDNFGVSATIGNEAPRNPIRISSDWRMADAGDSYICSYIVSDLPLDQPINIHVDVGDRQGRWQGSGQTQPPPGEQRIISNGSQSVTLNAAQNRARLSYEMVYAPLPGR